MDEKEQDLIQRVQDLDIQINVWKEKINQENSQSSQIIAAWEQELQGFYAERTECEQELEELRKKNNPLK